MIVYVVTNHGTMDSVEVKFKDSIKVFTDYKKAKAQFDEWAGLDPMRASFDKVYGGQLRVGVKSIVKCGEIDVEMIALELIE